MNQGNSPRGDTFASSECTHAFGAAARDGHGTAGGVGEVALHSVLHGNELRPVKHDRQVDVPRMPAGGAHGIRRPSQQVDRVGPLQRRVGVGEHLTDIAESCSPQDRVAADMRNDVGVTVPRQTTLALEADPTQNQRPVGIVGVGVDVEGLADTERRRCGGIGHALSPNKSSAI